MKKADLRRALAEYRQITEQLATLEKQREAVAEKIKRHMGEQQELQVDDTVIRYKPVTSSRFDSKAFAVAYESLYRQFCKAVTTRRFKIIERARECVGGRVCGAPGFLVCKIFIFGVLCE